MTNLEVELDSSPADDLCVSLVTQELQDELPEMGTVPSFRHFPSSAG